MPIIQLQINSKSVIHPGTCFVLAAMDVTNNKHTNITVNNGAGSSAYHGGNIMATAVIYVTGSDFTLVDASPVPSQTVHQLEYSGPSSAASGTYPMVSYTPQSQVWSILPPRIPTIHL